MSESKDTKNIPVDVVNNVSGESFTIQLSLAHNGEFGFTAELNIELGKKNDGLYANLFYYNADKGELEFSDCSIIENGKAALNLPMLRTMRLLSTASHWVHLRTFPRWQVALADGDDLPKNKAENMAIFKGVNEPIISEQDWQNAQDVLAKNKRVPRNKEPDLLQSYFYCADCGSKMYLRRKKGNLANYFCSGYSKGTVKCTTHLIKYSTLIELVLNNIRSVVAAANLDKEKFAKEIKRKADSDNDKEIKRTIKEADKMKARCAELDKIIQKLFEDRVNGRISDERYFKMTESYEKEQAEINEKLISYQEK